MVEVGDDGGELLLCLLVEVGHCNTCSEDGIVGMGDSHVCCSLGGLAAMVSGMAPNEKIGRLGRSVGLYIPNCRVRWWSHLGTHLK